MNEITKQAERYTHIIESSAEGILVLDSVRDRDNNIVDFTIEHCNSIGCKIARFPDNSTGRSLLQMLPHLAQDRQYLLHKHVVETGEPVQFETTFRDEKGQEYGWFMVFLQKLDDGVLSRFVDITERKINEQKIETQVNLVNSILDASQQGVFALRAIRNEKGEVEDFVFLETNDRYAKLVNRSKENIVGQRYLSIAKASKEAGLFDIKCQVLQTGIPIEKEFFYNADGVEGWFSISVARLGNDGIVETIMNITGVKKDKDRLTKIINTSRAGIFTLTPVSDASGELQDFEFGLVNKMVENFLETGSDNITGKTVSSFYPVYKRESMFRFFCQTFRSGSPNTFEYHFKDRDMYFMVRIDRLEDELLATFTDVTPLKKLQFRLQKSIEDLKRSNDSLEEFTSAASHDLKEPIRKINLLLSHFKNKFGDTLAGDTFRTFEKLETATLRMFNLVDDLLEYSHLSHEKPEWNEIDLNEKMDSILEDLEMIVEEKQARVHIGKLPVIKGHPRQVRQLFQNLLGNALKYSKKDVPPEITITASQQKAWETGLFLPTEANDKLFHVIEVTDRGIGFEQKYSDKIFNVFERLHGNYEYKGSGVGLAIARKVVQNHNGFIKAESQPGEGATFKIYLPA